jgi:hypothetical protein
LAEPSGRREAGGGAAYTRGGALLIARDGGGALDGATGGPLAPCAGTRRGAALGWATARSWWPAEPVTGRWGKLASSEIFWVGATRCADAASRAPQPPQNRESGAFSVPQLGQRIPSPA